MFAFSFCNFSVAKMKVSLLLLSLALFAVPHTIQVSAQNAVEPIQSSPQPPTDVSELNSPEVGEVFDGTVVGDSGEEEVDTSTGVNGGAGEVIATAVSAIDQALNTAPTAVVISTSTGVQEETEGESSVESPESQSSEEPVEASTGAGPVDSESSEEPVEESSVPTVETSTGVSEEAQSSAEEEAESSVPLVEESTGTDEQEQQSSAGETPDVSVSTATETPDVSVSTAGQPPVTDTEASTGAGQNTPTPDTPTPTTPGTNPTTPGTNPTTPGTNPTTPGTNPTTPGGDNSNNGGNNNNGGNSSNGGSDNNGGSSNNGGNNNGGNSNGGVVPPTNPSPAGPTDGSTPPTQTPATNTPPATTPSSPPTDGQNSGNGTPAPTGPQTSPATGVCPAIQFVQKPTNTDVTFEAQTTRSIAWVDVHINVLEQGQAPYPDNAPVENNGWFWNYRMNKQSDKVFNFVYTTGQNGFNFKPESQRLQYFFTYCSELVDCNTQSFVYVPSGQTGVSAGGLDVGAANQDQPQSTQSPGTGVCPALKFDYSVAPADNTYEVKFNPDTERDVIFVDVHFNVLEAGQTPYPANAIVEANNWFWNYRMTEAAENQFVFRLPTGQNGMNYDQSKTLQFFFTYCVEKTDCNTQSFVYNPASGALEAPPAPQPVLPEPAPLEQPAPEQPQPEPYVPPTEETPAPAPAPQEQPAPAPQEQPTPAPTPAPQEQPAPAPTPAPVTPPTVDGKTFCEKYSEKLFSNAYSDCYQTALFAAVVKRGAYGSDHSEPKVSGAFVQGSILYDLFKTSIPVNGQQYALSQLITNDKFNAILTQNIIEFMGRLFGCKAEGFPSFASNPDFASSGYQYADINAIRNTIKGLNLPKSFFDKINEQIVAAMLSFGVSQSDIDNIVVPAVTGFENGLIGQVTVDQSSKIAPLAAAAESSAMSMSYSALALMAAPVVAALLY